MCISNTIPNMGHYDTAVQWLALRNQAQGVHPTNIGAQYGGGDQAARYAYEALKTTFAAYKPHKATTVQMILYIFSTVVFLNLQDIHGFVFGHNLLKMVAQLERTYVTAKQKRDDITAMDLKMRQPFLMDDIIEGFFMEMTSAHLT